MATPEEQNLIVPNHFKTFSENNSCGESILELGEKAGSENKLEISCQNMGARSMSAYIVFV